MNMKPLLMSSVVMGLLMVLATSAEAGWRYRAPVVVYRPVPVVRVAPRYVAPRYVAPRYVAPVVPYYAPRRVYVGPYRYFGPGAGVVVGGYNGGNVIVRTPGFGLNVGY
jgi:hypothetical protein